MYAPLVQDKVGNIVDFWRFRPATFSRTRTPLEAKEWLNKKENLLEEADMLPERQVDVVKVQLTDVVRI